MAISITTTINLLFGSHLMDPDTGIIMNNEMNDFSIPGQSNAFGYIPMKSNFVKPGARPLSSISPLIATIPACESGKPSTLALVIGSAGGSRIITAVAQTAALLLTKTAALFDPDRADTGTDEAAIPNLHDALATPRLHDQLMPPQVSFEWTYDNSTVRYMKSLGANVTWVAPGQSTVQAVRRRRGGIFEAASEPRQRNSGANTA